MLIQIIEGVYRLLWGDLLTLHLGNVTLSLSFMVILLLTAGAVMDCLYVIAEIVCYAI